MNETTPYVAAPEQIEFGVLAQSLGFLLRISQIAAFEEYFAEFGTQLLRPGELSVLLMMERNPGIRQGVLARSLRIKRAHMAKMIRSMEEDGIVERTVPEDDRRSVELWLTEAGRRVLETNRAPFEAHDAKSGQGLTKREADELRRLLRKFAGIPDPEGEDRT